jgi:hypothetical protein
MTKRWTGLAAGFAALTLTVPCALATESDWSYRRQRAAEQRYEHYLRRQEQAQRIADRKYERAMRRAERAEQRRAYRESQREYQRELRHSYRDSRIF